LSGKTRSTGFAVRKIVCTSSKVNIEFINQEAPMQILRVVILMFPAGMMALGAGAASGQSYPSKLIRIVTAAPGSANDWGARLIAQELAPSLGQQLIVENRGGLGAEVVAKAQPDGYTLLFYGGSVWLLPFLRDNVPWDPVRDFSPVTLALSSPNIVVVHPSLPVKSVKALIALARARPGELNYAAGTIGASPHLSTELFKAMAGVDIVRVGYKGTGPSVIALVGGEVHLMFAGLGSVAPHVKSGRLRALAVTSARPSALAPELPTVAASLPGYETASILGIFAPAKTPAAIINRLHQEIVRAINRTEVKERLFNAGVEVVGSSPEEFAATVKDDMARMGKVIKNAGIHE
jgi:tripartite-type tricarboxylate transporter receptor subunit TctC